MNSVQIFDKVDYSEVVHRFVAEDGFIRVEPASEWYKYPWEQVRMFMHFYPFTGAFKGPGVHNDSGRGIQALLLFLRGSK